MRKCSIFFVLLAIISVGFSQDCSYNLKEFLYNAPIILQNEKIFYPNSETFKIKEGTSIKLMCPGNKKEKINPFEKPPINNIIIEVECSKGNLHFGGTNYKLQDFKCKYPPKATINPNINIECKKGDKTGKIKEVAFEIDEKNKIFIPVFKTCYYEPQSEVLYSTNQISGTYSNAIYDSKNSYCRPGFVAEGLVTKVPKFADLYSQKSQGNRGFDIKIDQKDYFAKGHLAAANDFNLCSTQRASYFLLNVAPQWQKFNCGSWRQMECEIQRLLEIKTSDVNERYDFVPITEFHVYTGTHETLKLKYKKDNNIKYAYLADNDQLPVPKYFWKLIYRIKQNRAGVKQLEGIVFIGVNDVQNNKQKPVGVCTDICEKQGFTHVSNIFKTSTIICCDPNEIKETVFKGIGIPEIEEILYIPEYKKSKKAKCKDVSSASCNLAPN